MILSYKYCGDVYETSRTECGSDDYDRCGNQRGYDRHDDCDECRRDRRCDDQLVLAIATVPMQKWRLTYSPEKALCAGTMFAELNLQFKGGKCR